jgi:hypothetical protein
MQQGRACARVHLVLLLQACQVSLKLLPLRGHLCIMLAHQRRPCLGGARILMLVPLQDADALLC